MYATVSKHGGRGSRMIVAIVIGVTIFWTIFIFFILGLCAAAYKGDRNLGYKD